MTFESTLARIGRRVDAALTATKEKTPVLVDAVRLKAALALIKVADRIQPEETK